MKIRDSVFGSNNEKELFKTLQSRWSNQFNLWPNIPFTNIIDINDSQLSDREKKFIYKTSIDYTLCKKDGNPLLSIEFDGLGRGFSKKGEYVQLVQTPKDPYRKLKLDLKLRIANEVGYPLFVVFYEEKGFVEQGIDLTIADGIIGEVLRGKYFEYFIKCLPLEYKENISSHSEDERDDFIYNLIQSADFVASERNPIRKLAGDYEVEATEKGLIKGEEYGTPELRDSYDNFESYLNDLENLAKKRKNAIRVGAKCIVQTPFGKISSGDVWVRNAQGYGVDADVLAFEIARLWAFKKVLDLYKEESHD